MSNIEQEIRESAYLLLTIGTLRPRNRYVIHSSSSIRLDGKWDTGTSLQVARLTTWKSGPHRARVIIQ
jgi:hypothetical protein